MNYGKMLQDMLKAEKNPINRMYLNEISIKWSKLKKSFDGLTNAEEDLKNLTAAINEFTGELANPKFKISKTGKGGFNPSHKIFSPDYIEEFLTWLINQSNILNLPGIKWGYQKFTIDLHFHPKKQFLKTNDSIFSAGNSNEYLSLTQQLDFQFRIAGTRKFEKLDIHYPVITFYIDKTFKEKDLIAFDYDCALAKATYANCRNIVICECLDHGFKPHLNGSSIDSVFVLRKQFATGGNLDDIDVSVLITLRDKLFDYLSYTEEHQISFRETGLIERSCQL